MGDPLVQVKNLGIGFTSRAGITLPILRNIDLAVGEGETIGLVGESGCGKSTLALAMMGYLKSGLRVLEGESLFRGRNVADPRGHSRRRARPDSTECRPVVDADFEDRPADRRVRETTHQARKRAAA
jgi:peptide/nickel transport system ATP-binding protein